MGARSPSKYMSLKRLEAIRTDRYVGENGIDYCSDEIDELINSKREKRVSAAYQTVISDYDALEIERIELLARVRHLMASPSHLRPRVLVLRLGVEAMGVARALGTLPRGYRL